MPCHVWEQSALMWLLIVLLMRSPYCKKAKQAVFSIAPMDDVEVIEVRALYFCYSDSHASQDFFLASDSIL